MRQLHHRAIVDGDEAFVRSCALYFDKVYSICSFSQDSPALVDLTFVEELRAQDVSLRWKHDRHVLIVEPVYDYGVSVRNIFEFPDGAERALENDYSGSALRFHVYPNFPEDPEAEVPKDALSAVVTILARSTVNGLRFDLWKRGKGADITFLSNDSAEIRYDFDADDHPESRGGSPAVSLVGASIIDASEATWEQVAECRKDTSSVRQLRRLRSIWGSDLSKKSLAEIEDIVLGAVDRHDAAAKTHGFHLATSSMKQLLDARGLHTAGAASIAAAAFGADPAILASSIAATAATASITIGKIVLSITVAHAEFMRTQQDCPLSYIVKLHKTLNNRKNG